MKILHLITSANPASGGPIEGASSLGSVLTNMGHQVDFATVDPPDSPWLKSFPLTIYAMGPSHGKFAYSRRLILWLEKNCKDYDVCIVNGLWQHHGIAAMQILPRAGVPYIVFTHGMLDPWFKRQYPFKHFKKLLFWPAQFNVLRKAAAVCFTAEQEKLLARESFKPYMANEVVVAFGTQRPGGDELLQKERFFNICPETRGKSTFLFLSRIHEKKGCDVLLQAFAKVAKATPNLHLVIAGPDDDGLRPSLEQLAKELDIDQQISWPGMLQGDAKWGAFRTANAFVLPSHQENFGIAIVEAMAVGCPVLISDKVNIWREIESDGAGFVATDTVEGTVKSFNRWLQLSDAEKQRMSKNAVESFNCRYEIHHAGKSLMDVLSKVVNIRLSFPRLKQPVI